MNYKGVLEKVEEKIDQVLLAGNSAAVLGWLEVIEKLKDCGLIQINKEENKKCQESTQVDKKLQVRS